MFQPDVSVYGAMLAGGGEATASQRRRWEFGRKEIRRKYLGAVAPIEADSASWRKLLDLCELTIPSMGTLAVLYAALAAVDLMCVFGPLSPSSAARFATF